MRKQEQFSPGLFLNYLHRNFDNMAEPGKEEKKKYFFKPVFPTRLVSLDKHLICPDCGQELDRADIEGYFACPFCGHEFERTDDLEDFLLQAHVDNWMRQQPGFAFQALD